MNNNNMAKKQDIIYHLRLLLDNTGAHINEVNKYIERIQVSIYIFILIKNKFRKIY